VAARDLARQALGPNNDDSNNVGKRKAAKGKVHGLQTAHRPANNDMEWSTKIDVCSSAMSRTYVDHVTRVHSAMNLCIQSLGSTDAPE
jgi:hypothetical protein